LLVSFAVIFRITTEILALVTYHLWEKAQKSFVINIFEKGNLQDKGLDWKVI
jgi:hypothetical protein